ncbi:MAG: LysR family transcriptional regulator [Bariatricus sp.]
MKNIDWEILKVLYEKGSITKAAESLYMTQSALTKRIKAIESEWNVEIVKRNSKGVIFTEEGKYLVQKSNIMLDFLKEIEDHFAGGKESKELLKIGVPNSFARLHMPKLLKRYTDEFDKLQIKTIPNSSEVIMRQLVDGTVDIGIICGDYPFLGEKVELFEEALFLVAPVGMKMDEIEGMPLIESFFNPMVKMMVYQWWKSYFGSMPHEAYHVPYSDISIEMVENGLGITFLFGDDWKINEEKVQYLPVYDKQGEKIGRKVWMMLSELCFKSQDVMDFVTFVEKYYQVN